jgi:hypothetical protein
MYPKPKGISKKALAVARQQQAKILRTPRCHEPRPPLALSGQATTSSRTWSLWSTAGLTEGFDTLDLKEAKALPEDLSA